MHRGLLVTRINNANPLAHAAIIDTGDVAATERKNDLNALFFQGSGNQPATMY
jgi:hypothetical protein